jgi:hypothetical protein
MESSDTLPSPQLPQPPSPSLYGVATPHLAALAQSIGIVAVIDYLLGYVIVNTYLGRYGMASRSPFSLQYVSSGMTLVLILALFLATTCVKVYRMDRDGKAIFSRQPKWAGRATWWVVTEIDIETTPGAAEEVVARTGRRFILQLVIDGECVQLTGRARAFCTRK